GKGGRPIGTCDRVILVIGWPVFWSRMTVFGGRCSSRPFSRECVITVSLVVGDGIVTSCLSSGVIQIVYGSTLVRPAIKSTPGKKRPCSLPGSRAVVPSISSSQWSAWVLISRKRPSESVVAVAVFPAQSGLSVTPGKYLPKLVREWP